jgi:serine/threonine protein kinase
VSRPDTVLDQRVYTHGHSQRTLAGTASYTAPEMILGMAYGRSIDIWVSFGSAGCSKGKEQGRMLIRLQALGVLTFEFVCGQEPFAADTILRELC